ncbi:hypothetical protein C8R46DRAFT_1071003 [Mycena filopes]|nr:hypothetical protein C8R46DRAFT_1071003 [Mycena filopes]
MRVVDGRSPNNVSSRRCCSLPHQWTAHSAPASSLQSAQLPTRTYSADAHRPTPLSPRLVPVSHPSSSHISIRLSHITPSKHSTSRSNRNTHPSMPRTHHARQAIRSSRKDTMASNSDQEEVPPRSARLVYAPCTPQALARATRTQRMASSSTTHRNISSSMGRNSTWRRP